MPRRVNPRLVKIHRNYSVEEAGNLLSVHKNTVRDWIKRGLSVVDDRKPILILGRELREFLELRSRSRKRSCQPWELYCLRCRTPKKPDGGMVDYVAMSTTDGRLIALCPECGSLMNRFARWSRLGEMGEYYCITIPGRGKHISDSSPFPENCDISS